MHVTDALPLASVVAVVAESAQLAPVEGTANVTVAPLSAVPFEITFATRGAAKAVPTCALWFDPLVAVITMVGGGVDVLVKAKLAEVVAPDVEAVTAYAPGVELAVNICEVAMPLALVVSVSVSAGVAVANKPLAPDDGAVKVTEMPLAGDPSEVTVAENVPNELSTAALVVYPLFAAMVMVGGAVAVLVKAKLAGVIAPVAEAATVYAPAVELAVNIFEVAMPLALVVSVSVSPGVVVANRPLAPDDGAVKVTETPLAGDPLEVTVADSVPNGLPTTALVVYPLFAAMAMIGGGVMFEFDEPPQLDRNPMARQTKAIAKTPGKILR